MMDSQPAGAEDRGSSSGISIVVPSYGRPESLRLCMAALVGQGLPLLEIIVVARSDDPATRACANGAAADGPVRLALVTEGGVLAAMAAGAAQARGSAIGFVDDDAIVGPGWASRIDELLRLGGVGGVGGRDRVTGEPPASRPRVGRISSWGRMTGNHHLGIGGVREVDVLKGVNMVFWREALTLPSGLLGDGAQVHFEVAVCLAARAAGWRLIYDSDLEVEHRVAARRGEQRGALSAGAIADQAFNYEVALLSQKPEVRTKRVMSSLIVGDTSAPGAVRTAVAVLRREHDVVGALRPSLRGRLAGWRASRGRRTPIRMTSFPDEGP